MIEKYSNLKVNSIAAAAISEASGSSASLAGKTKAAVIIPKKREHSQNGNTPESKRRLVQSPASSSGLNLCKDLKDYSISVFICRIAV
jgi:hypothetical protein